MSNITIHSLELENVKRIKALILEPTAAGLTVIGGNNNQGKTSVLDAICWALGGEKYRPSNAARDGSAVPPRIKLTLSNGLIVERSGKNSALKVSDPFGKKGGQQLLNEFISELALNLPKFLEANNREKAETLLQIIGVGPELRTLEAQISQTYQQRLLLGREVEQKKGYVEEMPFYPDVPKEPVSISELISQQQAILARNGENQRKRQMAAQLQEEYNQKYSRWRVLEAQLAEERARLDKLAADLETAQRDALDLQDESTEELERNIAQFEQINAQVRANMDRDRVIDEAGAMKEKYDQMTQAIEALRVQKMNLLNGAKLPLPELGVEEGELTYKGKKWDCMSGSARLRVATAIVRALKPNCSFVLVDGLEAMDIPTIQEFGKWAESEGLQIIATRVSTGPECSVIISDGYAEQPPEQPQESKSWIPGRF